MAVLVNGTNGITFADGTTQNSAASGFGFKNRIINGAMMIDQRANGAVMNMTGANYGTCDRWGFYYSTASKFTAQQNAGSVTPPAGFTNYLGITSTGAYSVPAGESYVFSQKIEGFNVADFAWGTASASAVTLSFRVYSSLTGAFGGSIQNSAGSRSYPFSYTIPTANTWTTIAVTIPGDTTGTWVTNTGIGVNAIFSVGAGASVSATAGAWTAGNFVSATGATSVVGTNGAKFYITGVQLEKGSAASTFDYRPYGTELMLCQRYYEVLNQNTGNYAVIGLFRGASDYRSTWWFKVDKRATPTWSLVGATTWSGATPTGYPAVGYIDYNASVSFYTANGVVGTPVLQAIAEL